MLGFFQIVGNFLDISSAIFGFSAFETVSEESKFWCYTHFVQNSRPVFTEMVIFRSKSE